MRSFIVCLLIMILHIKINAQIEDVSSGFKSNNYGLKILSLSGSEKDSLTDPEIGNLIFQTSEVSGFYYYDGNTWLRLTDEAQIMDLVQIKIKDQTQTAYDENNLVLDSSFVFNLDANSTYILEASLEFEENGAADAKIGWDYTGSIQSISYGIPGMSVSGAHITDLDPSNKITVASSTRTEYLKGYISSISSGTLTFMYAPFNDNGGINTLNLNANSFMWIRKI